MALDLVPVWTLILGLAVFMYVLLDGFDLGVGILFAFAPGERARDTMMASVAPIWDGNETWLVFGGLALFSAFPLAFAIIIPAMYFPILAMVLGLIFRGVAFEFRPHRKVGGRRWDHAFFTGSLVATFAQGCVLGQFIRGFPVEGRRYVGNNWEWLHPFVLAVGVGLVFGYMLLGATWLVMKTGGELQTWARAKARIGLAGVIALIVLMSAWTPLTQARVAERWFGWPGTLLFAPVPIATAALAWWLWRSLARGREVAPFIAALGLFAASYMGLAISQWPYLVAPSITLHDAAAAPQSQAFLLIGTLLLLPVIFGYTGWAYWVFRGKTASDAGYH